MLDWYLAVSYSPRFGYYRNVQCSSHLSNLHVFVVIAHYHSSLQIIIKSATFWDEVTIGNEIMHNQTAVLVIKCDIQQCPYKLLCGKYIINSWPNERNYDP